MTTSNSTKRLSDTAAYLAQRRRDAEKKWLHYLSASLRLCAILLVTVQAQADWLFARGGTDSTGATTVTLPDEPDILWTYKAEEGAGFEATPVIAGGVVYLGDAEGTMHAVKLADGSPIWTKKLGETFLLSPAAIGEGLVYAADADGLLHALVTEDGTERWGFDTESEVYGGPLVHRPDGGDALLLVPTEGGDLFALDAATGERRWSFRIEAPLRCTPTVVKGHTMLAACDGKLHTLNAATGTEVGSCEVGDPTGNTAAVVGSVAYFGTEGGTFFAVDASDPAKPTVLWSYRDPRRGQSIRSAAAVTADTVVYASRAKMVFALDPATGEPRWTKRVRSGVEAAPLVLGGGRVLLLTTRGRVLLVDLANGEEVWTYDAGGGYLAAPAAADGRVLIANTDGTLVCLGKEERN